MNNPLVTVITPSYNRASYICEVIESVISQEYDNLQYIVIDDGSKDNSSELIDKYAKKIQFIRQDNMGETLTVNRGFSLAQGDIIGVVNSDDPIYPGAIKKIVDFFASHPDVLVVYPDWDMIDQDGNVIEHMTTYDYNYLNMLRWHHCVPGPGTFFRKELVEKLIGRDPQFKYVADYDFWLRGGLLGSFARIPERLATFRVHPGSASVSAKGALMAKEHLVLIEKLYAQPNLPKEVKKLRGEAFSSAYYVGAIVSGHPILPIRRKYFLLALASCPLKYIGEYRNRLPVILDSLLPESLITLIARLKSFYRSMPDRKSSLELRIKRLLRRIMEHSDNASR